MCSVFKVSRSGYYRWVNSKPSNREIERERVMKAIKELYVNSNYRYGSPKITHDLHDLGWRISRPRVARLMKREGLRSIITKKFRGTTTDSRHSFPVANNILNRNFIANEAGQKWVSDITYIPTKQGWLYLTIVMDLYDRKIIGWALSSTMTTEATSLAALQMALKNRSLSEQLIFHSDQGVQYASYAFTKLLKQNNIVQSMSRKGNCWDNAVAENFFKILKSEMVKHTSYHSIIQAKNEIFHFIEVWYNRKRKHTKLGFKTPEEFGKANYAKCA